MTARDRWVQPSPAHTVDALTRAMDLIAAGWCQHRARVTIDGRDCYDPSGAVAAASGTVRLSWPIAWATDDEIPGQVVPGAWIRDTVTAALMNVLPSRFGTLAAYNDTPGRTQGEVLALFQAAIQGVRKGVAA